MHIPRCLLISAVMLIGTAQAFAEEDLFKDLSLQQQDAYNAGQAAQGKIKVGIRVDRKDVTYALGEVVHVYVKASADAYLMVVDVGPSGKVYQLFPNAAQTDNFVRANQEIEIPSATSGLVIKVSPPTGKELLKVVAATDAAKAILPDLKPIAKNPFPELDGGVPALTKLLDIIPAPAATNAPSDQYAVPAQPAPASGAPADQYKPPANPPAAGAPAGQYAAAPSAAAEATYTAVAKDDVTIANLIIRSIKKR
jgi:hypothetical protein